MSVRVAVVGGPHDGESVAAGGTYRWVKGRRGYTRPGPGRALYRLVGREYRYVGAAARWCPTCGGVAAQGPCPFGHDTVPANG